MRTRFAWISLALVVVTTLVILSVRHRPAGDAPDSSSSGGQRRPLTVRVAPAVRSSISLDLELTGSVEPYRVARLASPAEGPVVAVDVREGDPVAAGDVLVAIGRKQGVDALIASLREELKQEEDNLRRTRDLVESEALPGERHDLARAAVERVRAQLVQAEETARDFAIAAPWDGIISSVLVREGEFVAPRAALLEMYDPSSLIIRAAVAEQYAVEIAVGLPVETMLDAYPGRVLSGRISRVYPFLDDRMRTRIFEIVLDEDLDLLPGMFARLTLPLRTASAAVVIPIEAVVATDQGPVVYVVEAGKAVRRPVVTGVEQDNRVEIQSGIEPGEQVVVAGHQKLSDGAPVRVHGPGPGAGPSQIQGTPGPEGTSRAEKSRDGGGS
jgi:membrane fusion protein, multidrug efflux system